MAQFVDPQVVRDILQVNASQATTQWSNALIGSNIATASENLQRWTHRQFEPQGSNLAVTRTFSTNGAGSIHLPDLRGASSVTLGGGALTENESYSWTRDSQFPEVFVGIEFPSRTAAWSRGLNTFDINYNHLRWDGRIQTLPGDLSITSTQWGWVPYPNALLHATAVLAAYYTLRSDALLSSAINRLEEGVIFDLSRYPIEVQDFVTNFKIEAPMAVAL